MKAASVLQAADQLKDGITDFSDRVKELSGTMGERWKDTREDFERSARKLRIATEDKLEEARFRIKANPLAVVSAIAGGAFLLGVVTGWAASKNRR